MIPNLPTTTTFQHSSSVGRRLAIQEVLDLRYVLQLLERIWGSGYIGFRARWGIIGEIEFRGRLAITGECQREVGNDRKYYI